ncbi:ABC transporter substrate-binding protein [Jiangella asiatica]|uniref:Extracellular solute-binding protein n=1 Tax=Jiangella asiatica TaxID=2530372 RepID=A0A4R5DBU7_9ACTN|nr:substrate-binding domain-containing protein [Jiangella asiatica]TDE09281.1 extracellular solute-binding protein [Jiangella asiatica]
MTSISRRKFLQSTGLLGAASVLAACNTSPSSSGGEAGGSEGSTLQWWDHNGGLQAANKKNFELFKKESGVTVEYTNYQPPKLGEALQLARQSDQLPDVHSLAALKLPLPALIKDGWFQPLQLDDEALSRLPEDALVEGIHIFDGKVYTIPVFNSRQYWGVTWLNKDMLAAAEVEPPGTYDEFRAAAKAVQDTAGDDTFGWIFNFGNTGRVAEIVNYLAQPAGFEGFGGRLFKTGEIEYHHDAYLAVIEFLLSLQQDGLMFPGSQTLVDQDARVRWAAGAAGFFFDGPWCTSSVKSDAAEFLDKVGVAPMLVPDSSAERVAYKVIQRGVYHLSASSTMPAEASQLIGYQTTEDYYVSIAEALAQPPLDLSVIDKAETHSAWRTLIDWYGEQVHLAPEPVVKNSEVEKVAAQQKPIQPDLGQIVAGAFSGDVPDVKAALKEYSDKLTADWEKSVAAAKKDGAEVELDDYAFPNWKPKQDYTKDMYI